jgi:hypothetical protein
MKQISNSVSICQIILFAKILQHGFKEKSTRNKFITTAILDYL